MQRSSAVGVGNRRTVQIMLTKQDERTVEMHVQCLYVYERRTIMVIKCRGDRADGTVAGLAVLDI